MSKKVKRATADSVTLSPYDSHKAIDLSALTFRKQILPIGSITYEGRKIDFDRSFLTDLAASFKDGAYDQVPFVLANPTTNAHNMDPERVRGDVVGMEVTDSGLDAIITFPDARSAAAVRRNPKLGVSARIVQGLQRVDGKSFGRAIQHVLGTIDPRVTGMAPWTEVSLSGYSDPDEVLDLTQQSYERKPKMGKKAKKGATQDLDLSTLTSLEGIDLATLDLSEATDEEFLHLLELAQATAPADEDEDEDADEVDDLDESDESDEGDDDDEDEDDDDDESAELGDATQGGADGGKQTSLSNAHRTRASRRARLDDIDQMRLDLAADRFKTERSDLIRSGVPRALVDLAAPLLSAPDDVVLDLSNSDKPVNASTVVRSILDEIKGLMDFKPQIGHQQDLSDTVDSEADRVLATWSTEYGNG